MCIYWLVHNCVRVREFVCVPLLMFTNEDCGSLFLLIVGCCPFVFALASCFIFKTYLLYVSCIFPYLLCHIEILLLLFCCTCILTSVYLEKNAW